MNYTIFSNFFYVNHYFFWTVQKSMSSTFILIMCGIVGIFIKNKKLEVRLGYYLSKMIDNMSSRGPDSAGFAIYNSGKNKKINKFSLCINHNLSVNLF